ncbi:hypothetical protein MBLNU459_g0834t1 [Dothideomycetes sp. NU459]
MALGGIDGASSITVAVRVRPFTIREAAQLAKTDDGPLFLGDGSLAAVPAPRYGQKGIRSVIKVVDDKCLIFDPPEDAPVQRFSRPGMGGKRVKDQTFGFDKVFDDNTTQGDVYEATTKGLLDSVLDGYNATVFAYGATGCGKTHTITGTAQQPGIIFMTMQELFERIGDMQEQKVTEITLSYLEIYNETIRDLLVPATGNKQGLMLREDAHQAVSVAGLSSHRPQNVQEVMDMLITGNAARTQSPTDANATSSRSHAVLQINVAQKDRNADISEPTTMATLSIIDLAGSERASATKNRGERLLEGANINKSLLALGSCINALCDPRKKNHVPYRNSKLTRLLKFSLGGNCRTVMIVCVSPSSVHFDETQNTLRYANRAKNIQTKVVRNVYNVDRHVKDYLKKIDEQMARINELQAQQKEYEGLAFAKFRKTEDKREAICKEGLTRIRAAFENSADERKERVNNMKRLRQIERRIGMISSWIGSFDQVCEAREDEEPPRSLMAMRKTAQGILVELEGSRQHYHQRLAKGNWERAIDSALQNGIRQLQETESAVATESTAIASLKREVEVLKGNADREAHTAVLEQDKAGETALMQIMLQAHFETIAIIGQIVQMDEQDAVQAARNVLGKLLTSCSEAVSQVIKPDGGLTIIEAVPPTRSGTPKKKKAVNLTGPSPIKAKIRPSLINASHLRDSSPGSGPSPARASPRRKKLGVARKAFAGPSRHRSPVKVAKRGVRWRDDTEDGKLAEFQATPPARLDATPEENTVAEFPELSGPAPFEVLDTVESSPIPPPPVSSSEIKSKNSRFQAGFLTKRPDGSPGQSGLSMGISSDNLSPLREIKGNSAPQPGLSLNAPDNTASDSPTDDGSSYNSSDNDDHPGSLQENRETALKIHSAMKMKRASSGSINGVRREHRRRSPTAATAASQAGPDSGMFTASHARRMVKSEKGDEWKASVLSPRTAPVLKGAASVSNLRRTTLNEATPSQSLGGSMRTAPVREAIVGKGPKVKIVDSPVPKAGPGQVVIKVAYSGSNPKDWKRPEYMDKGEANQGDDIAGTVYELGEGVSEFKKGDRVIAFHEMMKPGGSYAEYGVAWSHTTAHLPDKISFQEGAAIPLAALTSAVGLYARLGLPQPWLPATTRIPLVIYGASSAVGSYALQLAAKSNIHPLICVAGKAGAHVEKFLDRGKGDTIVDYRGGDAAVVEGIKAALDGGEQLRYAFDCVSEKGSFQNLSKVLAPQGGSKITLVLPGADYSDIPAGIEHSTTMVGDVHGKLKDFGYVYFRYLTRGLEEGWFKPQPQEVVPGGLAGVQQALQNLKDGKASAVKYVFKIADTEGAGAE